MNSTVWAMWSNIWTHPTKLQNELNGLSHASLINRLSPCLVPCVQHRVQHLVFITMYSFCCFFLPSNTLSIKNGFVRLVSNSTQFNHPLFTHCCRGLDADDADGLGMTPLMVACQTGRQHNVELLLSRGESTKYSIKSRHQLMQLSMLVGCCWSFIGLYNPIIQLDHFINVDMKIVMCFLVCGNEHI